VSPPSFPPSVPCSGAPFPPQGPPGCVPLLQRYYEALRLPDDLHARLRFLRQRATTATRPSLPRESGAHLPRAWAFFRLPSGLSTWSRQDLPGSWWTLLCACPALRPRRDPRTWPVSALGCCLPLLVRRRLSRRFRSFEAQSRGPHTRCLRFAARVAPAPRKTRFRLVASFAGRGLNPQGPFVKFPLLHRFLLTQALPGAHESSDTLLGPVRSGGAS